MTTKKKPISNEPAETPITEGAQTQQDEQKVEQAKSVMDSGPVAEGQQIVSIIRVEKRRVACKLSDDELRTYSDQLALVTQEISEEERAQRQAKEELRARLSAMQTRQGSLALMVSRREEYRIVEVNIVRVPDTEFVQEVRQDTGAIIGTRSQTEGERRLKLF